MDKEICFLQMEAFIKETLITMTLLERESTNGLMAESTQETGRETKWKVMAESHEKMAELTKALTSQTKSMEKELLLGRTEGST